MYTPAHFAEIRVEVLHQLMRACPLAGLVTTTPAGLVADHLPLLLAEQPGPYGTLQGHLARANPVWRTAAPGAEALVIFQGADAYVSPGWYPTKAETGKVVPTWNYAVVHAHGPLRIINEAAWLRDHLERLTAVHEASSPTPWRLSDAPPGFVDDLLKAVVGFEITITRLEGKWKVSQNQSERNRQGVREGLATRQRPQDPGMAHLVAHGSS